MNGPDTDRSGDRCRSEPDRSYLGVPVREETLGSAASQSGSGCARKRSRYKAHAKAHFMNSPAELRLFGRSSFSLLYVFFLGTKQIRGCSKEERPSRVPPAPRRFSEPRTGSSRSGWAAAGRGARRPRVAFLFPVLSAQERGGGSSSKIAGRASKKTHLGRRRTLGISGFPLFPTTTTPPGIGVRPYSR